MGKLVAIRPNATVDFQIEGVTFKIGVVPRHIYSEFLDVSHNLTTGKTTGGELFKAQAKLVSWAVRGHEGFCYEDGTPVEFKTEIHKIGGKSYDVVSEETIEAYYSASILTGLANRILLGNKGGDGAGGK